jgi:hypothetical protein
MRRKTRRKKEKVESRECRETSASLLIECHYENLGLRKAWNQKRIERMCSFLRMTYTEIGALVGVKNLDQKITKTRRLPLSVCILLTVIEKQYMGDYIPDSINGLFNFTGGD